MEARFRSCFCCCFQVEQLFRLGLRSRGECEELLQRCNWNLEESSALILDTVGSHGNMEAQLNR